MNPHSTLRCLIFLFCASLLSAAQTHYVPPRITQVIDTRTVQLKGNIHPLARPEFDRGVLPDSQPVDRLLLLLRRSDEQEAALRQLLDDQQTAGSPHYHAWLTPDEFGKQFGPADADIQVVRDWLASQGFQGIRISSGRTVIEFTGSVFQVRNAFHTSIHKFIVNGAERNANVSDPQIPAALAPVVAGVVSLHNFPRKSYAHRLGTFRRDKTTGVVTPLFSFGVGPTNGLGPADLATIYNVIPLWNGGIDGAGQTVAVVGDSNIDITDVSDFRSMFGLPAKAPQVIVNGPDPGINGDEVEATLDTQWAGAVAKNADVMLVITQQPVTLGANSVDLSAEYVIDNNLASVMSESFGACEATIGAAVNAFENALWQQAAAQGITAMVSTGDNGSAGCDDPNTQNFATSGLAVSGIASTPYNVAVGGTDFNSSLANYQSTYWTSNAPGTGLSAKSYIPEITWNDSCAAGGVASTCTASRINSDPPGNDLVAGSGGVSTVYTKPAWQTGTGVPADGKRDLPDISLFASNGMNASYYIFCEKDANPPSGSASSCDLNSPFNDFQGAGGTSFSSPIFASVMALVNQYQGSHGGSSRQGNANYVLYAMAAKAGASCTSNAAAVGTAGCVFYDLPSGAGNISVACQGGTTNCSNTSKAANQFGILTASGTPAYSTTAGYDLATGLGSVNVNNLVTGWTPAAFRTTNTSFVLNGGTAVSITHGAAVTVSGTVSPQTGGGTPTGTVTLVQGSSYPGPVIDTFNVGAGGAYSGSTSMLPGTNGTPYQVVAHYSGDGTFAASNSAPQSVTSVNKESSVVTANFVTFNNAGNPIFTTSAIQVQYGSAYILRVDVTNAAKQLCANTAVPCPTGTVHLFDNGNPLNDFLLNGTPSNTSVLLGGAGFTEDLPVQLPGGLHNLTATYDGDASYSPQPSSNTVAVTIQPAPTSTGLVANPTTGVTTSTPVTFTATITSSSNSTTGASGTVSFLDGSNALGSAPVTGTPFDGVNSAGGTATLSNVMLSAGTHSNITAHYNGDQNYAASTSGAAASITVTQGGSFTVSGPPGGLTVTAGNSGNATITVTPAGGFTGQVSVSCGTLPPGVTCPNSPVSIQVNGGSANGNLTVAVAPPSAAGATAQLRPQIGNEYAGIQTSPPPGGGWWKLSLGTGFIAMVLCFLPARRRYRSTLVLWMICVVSFVIGCGGGGGGGGGGVMRVATMTTITAPVTKAAQGSSMTFNIAVTASGATPGGSVQLFDGGAAVGSAVAVSNGAASISTSALTVGTHQISAHYLGDAGTLPSQSGALGVTATGTTSVGITSNPASSNNVSFNLTIN